MTTIVLWTLVVIPSGQDWFSPPRSTSYYNHTRKYGTMSDKLATIEKELAALREELDVAKVAKKVGEVCEELLEYSNQLDDPFDKVVDEPNQWHKNPGGGGCVIL